MTPIPVSDQPSPPLIARFMPAFSLRQVDRVAVAASTGHAYAAARILDMSQVGFVRLLFQLRTLPDRIAARFRGQSYPPMVLSTWRSPWRRRTSPG